MSAIRSLRSLAMTLFFLPTGLFAETVIKGGQMELNDKGEVVLFKDGVRLERDGDIVDARQMKTTKKRDKINASGNVKLFRKFSATETWKAFGETGYFETQTNNGYLIGGAKGAHMIRTELLSSTRTRQMDIFATRFDFSDERGHARASGKVYAKTVDPETAAQYEFWSEEADYDEKEKQIVLSGEVQSRVLQTERKGSKTVTGDTIVYRIDTRGFTSRGRAQAVFVEAE